MFRRALMAGMLARIGQRCLALVFICNSNRVRQGALADQAMIVLEALLLRLPALQGAGLARKAWAKDQGQSRGSDTGRRGIDG